jgi:hypothetical protein
VSRLTRRLTALASGVLVISAFALTSAQADATCSLYAGPGGSDANAGTQTSPFATPQHLADSLTAGQTGCLLAGTYDLTGGTSGSQLKFNHGGASGAPITFESVPGQTATLVGGVVYVPHGSDYVDIKDLHINTHGAGEPGVQIMGAYDQLTGSDVTNLNSEYSCIILGSDNGYGQATYTLVSGNVVHQCGYNPSDPYEDHGVYDDNSLGVKITDNIFWGMPYGWGVQLYPDAQGTQVTHNVIDDNGQGVVIGGNSASASANNTVAYNVISNSSNEYDIQSWWGGAVGSHNVTHDNCVWNGHEGTIQSPQSGFSSVANVVANPGYTNPSSHDYELSLSSPCLAVVGYDTARELADGSLGTAQPVSDGAVTSSTTGTSSGSGAGTSSRTGGTRPPRIWARMTLARRRSAGAEHRRRVHARWQHRLHRGGHRRHHRRGLYHGGRRHHRRHAHHAGRR